MNNHPIMRYFEYEHLPDNLQAISKQFGDLAFVIVANGGETTEIDACLRKLLEAKDCAVRAALDSPQ